MKNNKNAAELRNLAKNLKASAVKIRKSVAACPKVAFVNKNWHGCHSELPTDTKWNKIKFGVFDAVKGDRGDNRAICAAAVQLVKNRKF
jgi:hypothetical protein